jgi:hypothetical protein
MATLAGVVPSLEAMSWCCPCFLASITRGNRRLGLQIRRRQCGCVFAYFLPWGHHVGGSWSPGVPVGSTKQRHRTMTLFMRQQFLHVFPIGGQSTCMPIEIWYLIRDIIALIAKVYSYSFCSLWKRCISIEIWHLIRDIIALIAKV